MSFLFFRFPSLFPPFITNCMCMTCTIDNNMVYACIIINVCFYLVYNILISVSQVHVLFLHCI